MACHTRCSIMPAGIQITRISIIKKFSDEARKGEKVEGNTLVFVGGASASIKPQVALGEAIKTKGKLRTGSRYGAKI